MLPYRLSEGKLRCIKPSYSEIFNIQKWLKLTWFMTIFSQKNGGLMVVGEVPHPIDFPWSSCGGFPSHWGQFYGGFLKWGYPQIIQVMDDHVSIETYGDLGMKPPYISQYLTHSRSNLGPPGALPWALWTLAVARGPELVVMSFFGSKHFR